MDNTEFLGKMLAKGKITQTQHDNAVDKESKKQAAKEKYGKDKTKLTKAELQAVIEDII